MSRLARELIAENRDTEGAVLDLGRCGLTRVPDEIVDLSWVVQLNLSDYPVWAERGASRSEGFQKWEEPNEHLRDLRPLAAMKQLRALSVGNTDVDDLSPLASLVELRALWAFGTRITNLLPLAGLVNLCILEVGSTCIDDIAPLAALRKLRYVGLSKTLVFDLRPLSDIVEAGVAVSYSLFRVADIINIAECPLTIPPSEIIDQGNAAILNYFRERDAAGVDHLYEAKLLILGEGGVGKTSLLRRLYRPGAALPGEHESTHGIDIHRHDFTLANGRRFRLNVWDFGGQEIYHATHQFFLTRRSLYVLVDDTRKDYKAVQDEGFKYPLELIDLFGDHSPVLIFQNEKGGRSKDIDIAGIKGRFDNVRERYCGNLESPDGADALREAIEFHASHLGHIGDELPAGWIKVREEVEAAAARAPHISRQEYFELYARHLPRDETKALHLSRYFHDLGVFLHFQDDTKLASTVILQNQWATRAVFRILDDETVKARCGRFGWEDCERLWGDPEYAHMHAELLALMERFELCYPLRDSRPEARLAPQLLPASRPATLPDAAREDALVLRYRYDFMPKGLVSRLIVRLHRFVRDPARAWRTGAVFERDGTQVQVEILPRGGEIELRARGAERKALLSVVAAELDALNEGFTGLRDKVGTWIPCICPTCTHSATPHFFDQRNLLKRREHGVAKVQCDVNFEEVDVVALLDGIRVDAPPKWAKERRIRIFLASSAELRADRDAFDLFVRQQNDRLLDEGVYLQVQRWEHFLDAMSETRLQDEYNKAVRECDWFVSLYFTKIGKYTEEEFDVAHRQFNDTGLPKIYTYFKDAEVKMGNIGKEVQTLLAFKDKVHALGHFNTVYNDIEHLKRQFRDQIDRLLG